MYKNEHGTKMLVKYTNFPLKVRLQWLCTLSFKVRLHLKKSNGKCPYLFPINCHMVMCEKLLMLKFELDYISQKGLLCCILKLSDQKKFSVMIQIHSGKTMLKKSWMLSNLPAMIHFQFMVLILGLHFLLLVKLGGFGIPIASIPCEPKRLCVTNLIHLNCFNKITSFSIYEKTLHGINPTPHMDMSMMCNNLLKVDFTCNKLLHISNSYYFSLLEIEVLPRKKRFC